MKGKEMKVKINASALLAHLAKSTGKPIEVVMAGLQKAGIVTETASRGQGYEHGRIVKAVEGAGLYHYDGKVLRRLESRQHVKKGTLYPIVFYTAAAVYNEKIGWASRLPSSNTTEAATDSKASGKASGKK
jgi:hypothetical protein